MVDLCSLLHEAHLDINIATAMERMADTLTSKKNKVRYSQQQVGDIAARCKDIIAKKLPNPRFIKHNGYAVSCSIQIARMQRANLSCWTDLKSEADMIPNLADRCFVKGLIGTAMASRFPEEAKKIMDEMGSVAATLPAIVDRVSRLENLAAGAALLDPGMSKRFVRGAMESTLRSTDPSVRVSRRRLTDLAYSIDPELAASLASLADEDPARAAIKADIRRRVDILNTKRQMVDNPSSSQEGFDPEYLPKVARMILGSLNAGRVSSLHIDRIRFFIEEAARLEFNRSYIVFDWAIENLGRTYSKTNEARLYIRPAFDSCVLAGDLALLLAARPGKKARGQRAPSDKDSITSISIRAGEREKGMSFLANWLSDNAKSFLKICDQYFGPGDLEVLKLVLAVNPLCAVSILTSRKHQDNEVKGQPLDDAFRLQWKMISDQAPPETEIVVAGFERSKKSPVHDRWWITDKGGLRVGTSINSLGRDQLCEISLLSQSEAEARECEIDLYLQRRKKEVDGERIRYTTFNL